MRIRIVAAGPPGALLHGRPWPAVGDVVEDYPTPAAAHLVASGVAEEVSPAPPAPRRQSRKARSSA
ncbi:hypothetical protein BIU87_20805 [Streptomyces sp. ZS0098]|uniref:hypothetical protein n=1 Tax=Streptomyces sp. ZS0098 TaxID=1904044 RepID=UPI000EFDA0B3|nr:hypothetical protein [Streptomyces sp. ZS0098]RMI92044.1 hypothetical protein BIU87_20805 [Streptomyces sp. ZS0098]